MQFNYKSLEKLGNYLQFEELRRKIDEAISKLQEELIETFRLSRFEELSYSEIVRHQGISIKTVEARISKSLGILRVELKEYLPMLYLILKIISE